MGNPSPGPAVQSTMSLSKGTHRRTHSVGDKSNSIGKLFPGTPSPITFDEKSNPAFLGGKKMRTRSSCGSSEVFTEDLELYGASLLTAVAVKTPLSSTSIGGHKWVKSGSVTPEAAGPPKTKEICTPSSRSESNQAVGRIAISLFRSPRKLERSVSLSRVPHRIMSDADIVLRYRDEVDELEREDFRRSVDSRLQALVGSDCHFGRKSCSVLLDKKMESSDSYEESCDSVPIIPVGNPSLGSMVSSVASRPEDEHLCVDAAHFPVITIYPVDLETANLLHADQVTVRSLDMEFNPKGVSRMSSFSNGTSTHLPALSKSDLMGLDAACDELLLLELQNRSMSSTLVEIPDPIINHVKDKEVTLTLTSLTKDSVGTQGNEANQNNRAISSSNEGTGTLLTEAVFLSSRLGDTKFMLEKPKSIVTDEHQSKDVEEILLRREKEVTLSITFNDPDSCRRKSTGSAPGRRDKARTLAEKRKNLLKRRRSVSASDLGALLVKVVCLTESEPPEKRAFTAPEPELSRIDFSQSIDQLQRLSICPRQGAQAEITEKNIDTEAVDMDVEYEDCSTELTASDTDSYTDNVNVRSSSGDKVVKQPSEEKLQVVDCGSINSYNEHDKQEVTLEATVICDPYSENENGPELITPDNLKELEVQSERFLDARDLSLDHTSSHRTETSCGSEQEWDEACSKEMVNNQETLTENASLDAHGVLNVERFGDSHRISKLSSHGSTSHDLDSSTGLQAIRSGDTLEVKTETEHIIKRPLFLLDENENMITRERAQSFASKLQVLPRQSLDDYRSPPSAISILANPSFSSSHQDRLWEEQAEAYSSGGHGTPSQEYDARAISNDFDVHSLSLGGTCNSDDQIHSCATSLRKDKERDYSSGSAASGFMSDSALISNGRRRLGLGKSKVRPRTPLRALMAQELDSKAGSTSGHRLPERGHHFLHHLMSRIRGSRNSSKLPSLRSSNAVPKRRSTI